MEKRDIQKDILTTLVSAEKALRYSELQPENVESDLFNYHLKYLIKQELVEKKDNLYLLSEKGKLFVINEKLLDPLGKYTEKIKANVINYVLREGKNGKEVLFQKRQRHPFFGMQALMGRSMNRYEKPVDAAKRGLLEETGLDGEFELMGIIRVFFYDKKGNIIDDCIAHQCYAKKFNGVLKEKTEFGKNFWINLDEAIEITSNEPRVTSFEAMYLKELKTKSYKEISFFYHEDNLTVDKL